MYFLERFGFSAAPLVLGLILGPIAEANFIQGGMIADATVGKASYFLSGGLNIFLIAVVIASIALFGLDGTASEPPLHHQRGGAGMNRSQHILGSGLVFAVGIWVAWVSYTQQPSEAFLFPRLIASVFVVLAGWTFGKAVMGLSKVGSGASRAPCSSTWCRGWL